MSSLYILDINPWSGTLVVSESQIPVTPKKHTIPYLTTLDFVTLKLPWLWVLLNYRLV